MPQTRNPLLRSASSAGWHRFHAYLPGLTCLHTTYECTIQAQSSILYMAEQPSPNSLVFYSINSTSGSRSQHTTVTLPGRNGCIWTAFDGPPGTGSTTFQVWQCFPSVQILCGILLSALHRVTALGSSSRSRVVKIPEKLFRTPALMAKWWCVKRIDLSILLSSWNDRS